MAATVRNTPAGTVHTTALDGALAISAGSLAEFHVDVVVTTAEAIRAERLGAMLKRRLDALPFDDHVATSCGRLSAAVAQPGADPDPADSAVARA